MLGEPLRQDDQYGPCGRIVDREEGLQELEGVASDRFRLRRRYVKHGRPPVCGRAVSRSTAAGRLQLDYIATLEGSRPLDLATRHHAYLCRTHYIRCQLGCEGPMPQPVCH